MISAGLRNECKKFFILWRQRSRSLQRRQSLLRLRVPDVGLRQQILDLRAIMPAAAQTIQNVDREIELADRDVAKRQIEIRCVFASASSTRGQQVRDGLTEKAFAGKRGSGLELAIGILPRINPGLALLPLARLVPAPRNLLPARNLGADLHRMKQDDQNRSGDREAERSPNKSMLAENTRYLHLP